MQKPKLFCDLDGVVFNTISTIVNMYNDDYKAYPEFKQINPVDIHTWDFKECKCTTSNIIDFYFCTPRFFDNLILMKHADTILLLSSYIFEIILVSLGDVPNLKLKEKWISKHIPYAKFIGVDSNKYDDKSHIDMTDGIFIDDSTKNLRTSNAKYKILFGEYYPWNQDDNGFVRCLDWIDTYREITRIEKNKSHGMEMFL